MVHAFVLVKADVAAASGVVEAARELDAVTEGHVVAGDWDLILELDAPEVYDVLSTTADLIQALSGVVDTKTYVSLEG